MKNVILTIEDVFGVKVESKEINNILFLKVHGIDTLSLSKWLSDKFSDIDIGIKYRRLDKFSDTDWIIVENKE